MDRERVAHVWMNSVNRFASCFTGPGMARFRQLVCGLPVAESCGPVTGIVSALDIEEQWRAVEDFLEHGRWPRGDLAAVLSEMAAPRALFKGRHLWAVDDTKTLRSGKHIWGTCTFHEYTSRSPNRPETVRAHNWVLCGALRTGTDRCFLPTAARLYIRENQLPAGWRFRRKTELAVELLRCCARSSQGPHLGVFDGGYALCTVVGPLLNPPEGEPRVEFVTRLRRDSRLYAPPPAPSSPRPGRPRKWGQRLAGPQNAENWPGCWQKGEAVLYGRKRAIHYKQVLCQWHPAGDKARVHAFAFQVEGHEKPWYLVTSDLGLAPEDVAQLYATRFVQEDAHRDLKQHFGFGRCRGRLRSVVLRTMQLSLVVTTLMRLLHLELDQQQGKPWWPKPPWYRQKRRGSLRDAKRLLKSAREYFSQLNWSEPTFKNSRGAVPGSNDALPRAA